MALAGAGVQARPAPADLRRDSAGRRKAELTADWRRPGRSVANGNCVEAASGVQVRDSKKPDGPVLKFSPAAWRLFIRQARR
ncbi:MAG TPA: DUF397 domain-containing protein [Trebonia sp.]|nr:DUF397 domain-containing protein [Trebonia sp.]